MGPCLSLEGPAHICSHIKQTNKRTILDEALYRCMTLYSNMREREEEKKREREKETKKERDKERKEGGREEGREERRG